MRALSRRHRGNSSSALYLDFWSPECFIKHAVALLSDLRDCVHEKLGTNSQQPALFSPLVHPADRKHPEVRTNIQATCLARSAAVSELGCNDCNPLYRARAAFRREWGPQPGRQRRQPRARMRQGPWRRTLVRRRAFSGRAGVAADRGHGGRAAARPRDSNPVRAQQPVSGGNGAPGRRTARQHGAAPAGRAAALGMSIIDGQGPHRIFSHPAAGRAGLRRRAGAGRFVSIAMGRPA